MENRKRQAYLVLYFDAPLQSWGFQSRFDRRTTLPFPTRSGIIGLLCAAMGIDRNDTDALRTFDRLKITVLTLREEPILIDYHTVGGGYDPDTEKPFIPHTAAGKLRQGTKTTVVTYREYLQNSRFGAIVKGDRAFLNKVASSLRDPKWGIWLGRKCCIPADIIYQGIFDSEEEGIQKLREHSKADILREVREVDNFTEGTDTLIDCPLDFNKREFGPRRIKVEGGKDKHQEKGEVEE